MPEIVTSFQPFENPKKPLKIMAHCDIAPRFLPTKIREDPVKYDPRDLSRVFVRRPSGNFVEARYADVTLPSVTLREALTARRALQAQGRREVDMRSIIRTAMAQQKLVDAATRKTKEARRGKAAGPKSEGDHSGWGALRGVDSRKPVPFLEDTD